MKLVFLLAIWFETLLVCGSETIRTVIPQGFEQKAGNYFNNTFQFADEFQQLFHASLFSSIPTPSVLITEIAFRLPASVPRSYNATIPKVEIQLSTTAKTPNEMSRFWESNRSDDVSTVFSQENVKLSATAAQIVNPFDLRFHLDKPFLYNFQIGNLAMFIKTFGTGEFLGGTAIDAQGYGLLNENSLIAASDRDVNLGNPSGYGAITEFSYLIVPEPSSIGLMILGTSMLLLPASKKKHPTRSESGPERRTPYYGKIFERS